VTAGLSPRAGRLAELIGGWPRTRLPLPDLWRLLDEADPASRTDSRRRAVLAGLIEELARAEVISLPAARSYDRTERPHLPRFVTVPRPGEVPVPPRDIVWHPEVSWADRARLTPSQVDRLAAVNTWLFRERDELAVPIRERSLEIFGDEKVLDRLLVTNLFPPERVSMLRIRRVVPRMLTRQVGDGDVVLVVENSDTFDSLVRVLGDRPGPIGAVGWGSGAGFEASVLSIADLGRPVSAIRYFGDLDRAGLRIPANASDLAVASGLPPVRPAAGLYGALLRAGRPQPGQRIPDEPTTEQLVQWLDPVHRAAAGELLRSGRRLAQEAIGLRYLLRHDDWRET
jgi:hypothetical protein